MIRDLKMKWIDVNYNNKTISLYIGNKKLKTFNDVSFGKSGVTTNKIEGDMATPKGIFDLGFAFGTQEINTLYPYYKLNENCYWVSDCNSKYYNEWIEVTDETKNYSHSYMHTVNKIDWQDAEHLVDYPIQYELAIVIEYNLNPKQLGKGSAIFFHVKKDDYTAGCIATSKENLLYIINWIGKDKSKIYIH